MSDEFKRHHRLRQSESMRRLLSETRISSSDLVMPIFVNETLSSPEEVASMPGVFQQSPRSVLNEVAEIESVGINAVILFGVPKQKDNQGIEATNPNGVIQKAIRDIKHNYPNMVVIADCCMCEYTEHGHCGVLDDSHKLKNDDTLDILAKIAVSYAEAGADIIAPSGMMDGMVGEIRAALDDHSYEHILIMSYAAKYASALYGPFRDAAGAPDDFSGDRRHHQMNPSQRFEALNEAVSDVEEGADIIMVKPAGWYLDVIRDLRNDVTLPIAAYQVSGEYSMIQNAAKSGLIDLNQAMNESILAIKRAGAGIIITYFAKEIAKSR